MPALLAVDGLTVRYPGRRPHALARPDSVEVVKQATFDIARGETFGLIGESGSGKSTIGRALLRLVKPSAGSILFDGTRVDRFGLRTPLDYRRRVQCVWQDPLNSLDPRQSIGSSIAEAVRRHSQLRGAAVDARVRRLMDDVGLPAHHLRKFPHELSGGQQQRVAIARALAPDPDLIICDEAVSALDVSTQSQVLNLLEEIQAARGLSYLFITHDMSVVRHISSRIAVIHHGVIVESGLTEMIFQSPASDYTRSLIAAVPTISFPAGGARLGYRPGRATPA